MPSLMSRPTTRAASGASASAIAPVPVPRSRTTSSDSGAACSTTKFAQAWYSSDFESSYAPACSSNRAACSSRLFFRPAPFDAGLNERLGVDVAVSLGEPSPLREPVFDELACETELFAECLEFAGSPHLEV